MWHSAVIADMIEMKAAGVPFDRAWRRALQLHPPRRMDTGPAVAALFDDDGEPVTETPLVEFTRLACADAWHGRRPVLRGLVTLQLVLTDVDSRPEPRDRIVA